MLSVSNRLLLTNNNLGQNFDNTFRAQVEARLYHAIKQENDSVSFSVTLRTCISCLVTALVDFFYKNDRSYQNLQSLINTACNQIVREMDLTIDDYTRFNYIKYILLNRLEELASQLEPVNDDLFGSQYLNISTETQKIIEYNKELTTTAQQAGIVFSSSNSAYPIVSTSGASSCLIISGYDPIAKRAFIAHCDNYKEVVLILTMVRKLNCNFEIYIRGGISGLEKSEDMLVAAKYIIDNSSDLRLVSVQLGEDLNDYTAFSIDSRNGELYEGKGGQQEMKPVSNSSLARLCINYIDIEAWSEIKPQLDEGAPPKILMHKQLLVSPDSFAKLTLHDRSSTLQDEILIL